MPEFWEFVVSQLLLLLVGGSLLAWIMATRRMLRGQPILTPVSRSAVFWDGSELLLAFGLIIVFSSIGMNLAVLIGWIDRAELALEPATNHAQACRMLVGALAQLLVVVVVEMWIRSRSSHEPARVRNQPSLRRLIWIGVVGTAMLLPPTMVVQAILVRFQDYKHDLLTMVAEQPSWEVFVIAAVAGTLSAPIAEEYFFRKLLQGWLEWMQPREFLRRRFGDAPSRQVDSLRGTTEAEALEPQALEPQAIATDDHSLTMVRVPEPSPSEAATDEFTDQPRRWPMWVSAALFAAAHLGQGPAPVALFFLALGLGYLYRQTQSLIPSIIVHFNLNALTLLIVFLTTFGMLPDPKKADPPPAESVTSLNLRWHVPDPLVARP